MSAFIVVHVHVKTPSEWNFLEPYLLRIDEYIRKIHFVCIDEPDGFSFSESWEDRLQESVEPSLKNPTQSLLHFLESSSDLYDTDWILNIHADNDDEEDISSKISDFFTKIYDTMFPTSSNALRDLFAQIQEQSDMVGVHTYPYDYFSIKDELSLLKELDVSVPTSWSSFDTTFPQWKDSTVFEKVAFSILNKFQDIPLIDIELYHALFSDPSPLDNKIRLELIGQFMNPNVQPLFYYPDLLVMFRYKTWKEIFKPIEYAQYPWKSWERSIPIIFYLHKKSLQVISEKSTD